MGSIILRPLFALIEREVARQSSGPSSQLTGNFQSRSGSGNSSPAALGIDVLGMARRAYRWLEAHGLRQCLHQSWTEGQRQKHVASTSACTSHGQKGKDRSTRPPPVPAPVMDRRAKAEARGLHQCLHQSSAWPWMGRPCMSTPCLAYHPL